MTKKTKKKRPPGEYKLPPRVARNQQSAARRATHREQPPLPGYRHIFGAFGGFLLTLGMALFLWFPAHSLLQDLRERGVAAPAIVTDVNETAKFVKIKFTLGPRAGEEVELSEFSGMHPDFHAGDHMWAIYDPENPSRLLSRHWVSIPPTNFPVFGTSILSAFFLVGAVVLFFRRLWVLRNWPPEKPETIPITRVRLTKP
ncbi:DUF3592 domain-containing protein [Streptomyces sp. NPDC016675]|uniref:DUF3592 domain-containing protein n=1 Tax=Streptomyces sp. NPDC016675 TaxID=3364970 RepID=UPI0036F84D14